MKLLFAVLLVVFLFGCQAPKTGTVTFYGGDGSSIEKAVIICGASGESAGIAAEHLWLREHYPSCRLTLQGLRDANGHAYDKMDILTADGQPRSVFFDITSFFGQ
jgi:hypothetical protein